MLQLGHAKDKFCILAGKPFFSKFSKIKTNVVNWGCFYTAFALALNSFITIIFSAENVYFGLYARRLFGTNCS